MRSDLSARHSGAFRVDQNRLANRFRQHLRLPGPFHVFGDQVLVLRANRRLAVPIPGCGPWFLDDRAWREMHSDLRSTLPPYIIVEAHVESYVRSRSPAIMDLIASRYNVAFVGQFGTWYVRRPHGQP